MTEKSASWIFYPGDLELYHAMKQNFSRVERGCTWPAFWKSECFRQRVAYRREYRLTEETAFTVYGVPGAVGYVQAGDRKVPFGEKVICGPGVQRIAIHTGCIGCVPAVYVDGPVIRSDEGWLVGDYDRPPVPAASSRYFTDPGKPVDVWPMLEKRFEPAKAECVNGGALYTYDTELTAEIGITGTDDAPLVCLGESRAEALDTRWCYYTCRPDPATGRCPRRAFRYAFVPGHEPAGLKVTAYHRYVDVPVRARFRSGDDTLDRIFEVAAHTFSLCCDVFFLDGVKRDRWIWSGDAYQSLFVNRYLTGDRDIEQRTLTALRGNDPVTTHVNTIVDYSMMWILGVTEQAAAYGDTAYLDRMRPKLESMTEFLLSQRDGDGLITGREKDWIFVDWADFDREGPLCAEQMFLAAVLGRMAAYSPADRAEYYRSERDRLIRTVDRLYWDGEKGAYVDSWQSGRRHVTKHANILAVLFDIASPEKKRCIAENVLMSPSVPAIKTPYFRFFELEALCRMGFLREVLDEIRAYWGGMLSLGAVTFWEEYDPSLPLEKQYAMYGDPYGKSLCHAWAASPVYLLLRYFVGLTIDAKAPGGYTLEPAAGFFGDLDCAVPVGDRILNIRIRDGVPFGVAFADPDQD